MTTIQSADLLDTSVPPISFQGGLLSWISKARELTTKALVRAATEDHCLAEAIQRGDPHAMPVVKVIATRVLRNLASRERVQDLDALWLAYLRLAQVPEEVIGRVGSVWLRRDQRFRRTLRARLLPISVLRESIGDRQFPGRRLLRRMLDAVDVVTAMSLIDRQERAFGRLLMQVYTELSHANLSAADRAVLRPILDSCKEVAAPLLQRTSNAQHEGTVNVILASERDHSNMLPGSMIRFTFGPAQKTEIERPDLIGEDIRRSMRLESWHSRTKRHILFKHDRGEGMPPCIGGSGSLAFQVALQMCSHRRPMSLAPWLAISGGEGGTPVFGLDKKVRVAKSEGIRLLITPLGSGKAGMFSALCRDVRVLFLDADSPHRIFRNTAARRPLEWATIVAKTPTKAMPANEQRAAIIGAAEGSGLGGHLWSVRQRAAAGIAAVHYSRRLRLGFLIAAIGLLLAGQTGMIGRRPIVVAVPSRTPSLTLADKRVDHLRALARERVESFRMGQTSLRSDPVPGDEAAWGGLISGDLADMEVPDIVARSFSPFTVIHHSATRDLRDWVEIRDVYLEDANGLTRQVAKADRIASEPIEPQFFHVVYKLVVEHPPLASATRPGGWVAFSQETGGWAITDISASGVKNGEEFPLSVQIFAGATGSPESAAHVNILPGQPLRRIVGIVDLSPLNLSENDIFEIHISSIYWNGMNDQTARGLPRDWAATRLVGQTHRADLTLLFRESARRGVMYFTKPADDRAPMDPIYEEIPERLIAGSVYQHSVDPGLDSKGVQGYIPPSIVGVRWTDNPTSIHPVVRSASIALFVATATFALVPFGLISILFSRVLVETLKPVKGAGNGAPS